MLRRFLVVGALLLVAGGLAASSAWASSGQVSFGKSTVEPAINGIDGSTVYLLTPDNAPFPSKANAQHAVAPLWLVAYPQGSTVDPTVLNCQPDNCDHVNVLPFVPPGGVYPSGTITNQYGTFTGGLLVGHDHIVGVPPPPAGGDFNVAWHVILVVFTPKAVADGAINNRIMTIEQINDEIASGDVFTANTPITFHCSIVSSKVYTQHQ